MPHKYEQLSNLKFSDLANHLGKVYKALDYFSFQKI